MKKKVKAWMIIDRDDDVISHVELDSKPTANFKHQRVISCTITYELPKRKGVRK